MPFHLKYTADGKIHRRQFNSYYECATTKEQLRKQGIQCQYSESGRDITGKDYTPMPIKQEDKQLIKNFLKICDNVKDL